MLAKSSGNICRRVFLSAIVYLVIINPGGNLHADFGDQLMSFTPSTSGNGRAVAFDPATGKLYYTITGSTDIFITDAHNTPATKISPGRRFGALSWDAKRGVLWGGAYQSDRLGNIYQITPQGVRTFQFRFVPPGGNCYGQTPGFIDGLAYDEGASLADSDDSLWISDDAGFKLHQVDLQGNLIASFTVPKNPRSGNVGCNTGIAVDGEFLWLALQSGADQQPHDIVQVSKSDPTKVVRSFAFSNTNIPGPEGLALDTVTIPGVAALWTNQFGSSNRLRLWEIRPSGLAAGWGANNSVSFVSEPVNTATGNYFYQRSDLVLPGRGVPFIFTRSYNSQDSYAGPLGHGWTHSFNVLLEENPGDGLVRIKQADGHTDFYTSTGGGNYAPQFRGVFDSLVKNGDGSFTLRKKNQTLYQFSPSGKLTNVIDRNGNTLSLTYEAPGNLRTITDTVGRTVALSYNASNRIRELTDPIGRTVRYSYDASENLASVTDPSGGVMTFTYDVDHRLLEIRDERGNLLVANTYDGTGRVVSQTNGRGFKTTFAYGSPHPGETTVTDPRGFASVYRHDSFFRLIERRDPNGNPTSYTYDDDHNRTRVTDQNGNASDFTYDSKGNLTSVTDPLSKVISLAFDSQNNLTSVTNARGFTTAFTYDGKGNLSDIQDPLGNTTNFAYDDLGQLIRKTDARANTTEYAYDLEGNVTRITDPSGGVTTLSYDGIGRLLTLTDPNGPKASASYDANGRLAEVVDPLGNTTRFGYDPVGNLTEINDAKGNRTIYGYDTVGNLIRVTDELGHVTQYTYDENNNRTALTDPNGSTTNYTFDGLDHLSQIFDPLGNKTAYSYDPVGNVSSVNDANGATNTLSYDGNNRLKQIAYEDGASVVYDYDPDGNRTTMLDSRGTTSYTYDVLDRLTQVVHPDGSSVGYSYDEVGNRTSLTLPEGKAVTYFYDALSRLTKVTDWEGRVTTHKYDAASNLLQVANPNSTTVSYQYDAGNRLVEVEHRSERRLLARFTYTLDELGNRIEMVEEGKAAPSLTNFVYEYDVLSQLLAMEERRKGEPGSRTEYSYDAVGNRVSLAELRFRRRHGFVPEKTISYIYDAAGRLLQAGETTYSYDNNGSRLTEENAAGLNRSYTYDSANRLTRVVDDSIEVRYTYDGDGNKVGQTIDNGCNTEFFGFLNDVGTFLPLVLREVGPEESIDYIYGLGLLSEYVARKRGRHTPRAFSYHADGLGSTGAITGQHAMPRARFEYDQWGNLLQSHGSAGSRFLFSGEEQDPETGFYYLRARWYDPSVGRFLTKDKFPGVDIIPLSVNRYSYVFNNPLNLADPSGELPSFLVGAIVGGVYGGVVSYVSHGLLTHNWWSRDALAATLGGAAGGTIKGAVALSGLGLAGSLTGTTLANLVGSLIETSVAGEPFNPTAFIADVGLKAGGDLLSGWFYPLPNGFKPTHLFTTSGGFTGYNGTTLLTRAIASQLSQFPFRPDVANAGFETRRILRSQILPVEVVSRLRK